MTAVDAQLAALTEAAPTDLNLTNPAQLRSLQDMAQSLVEVGTTVAELRSADEKVARDASLPISVRVATKLALGRASLAEIAEPLHLSLVVAVYKEHQRILRADEHRNGEDFLREKLRQLRWLFDETPRHSWDLTVVDDGCPEGSGRIARSILEEYADPQEEVGVIFLEDAIQARLPIVGTEVGDRFAELITSLDAQSFATLTANVPAELTSRDLSEFDDFHSVTPEELKQAAGL